MDSLPIRFLNHLGESFTAEPPDFHTQDGDKFNAWSLTRNSLNGRTVSMGRGECERTFTIAIASYSDVLGLRDAIYDVAVKDIEYSKCGRLYIGNWYLTGFLKTADTKLHQYDDGTAMMDFTYVSDTPYWTHDHVIDLSGSVTMADLDHPHNYPHDYGSTSGRTEVNNLDIVASQFRMVMFGPANNPSVTIGDTTYRVDVSLAAGEQLIIDSLADGTRKTIEKKSTDGTIENVFGLRHGEQRKGSGSYVFEPIPSGISTVSWNGEFNIQLTIYERRLQRRW